MEDPGSYAFRAPARPAKMEARRRLDTGVEPPPVSLRPRSPDRPTLPRPNSMALEYPLRSDLLAQVVVPRDLTVEEAQRMGAFLLTLAVDFKPAPVG